MIRRGDWKYNFTPRHPRNCFNLHDDPEEMHNLAALPQFKAKADELEGADLRLWYRPPE